MSRHVNRTRIQVTHGAVTYTARFRKPLPPCVRVTKTSLLMAARRGGVDITQETTLPDGAKVGSGRSLSGPDAWLTALELLQSP